MDAYKQAMTVMQELFSRDCQFALATANDNVPSVRIVDAYYETESFYIVTYAKSQKAREMRMNGRVALCRDLYRFTGTAHMIGHPLEPQNESVQAKLIEAFAPWYFKHNDESDPHMCYIRIDLLDGFFHKDGTGYKVNFEAKEAEAFPFDFNPVFAQ